jgi:hypothetical protein
VLGWIFDVTIQIKNVGPTNKELIIKLTGVMQWIVENISNVSI